MILIYLAVAYVIHAVRRNYYGRRPNPQHAKKLFDGAAFAGSALVMIGIFDTDILKLLGDTTLYLAIAALAGLGYTLRALIPPMKGDD